LNNYTGKTAVLFSVKGSDNIPVDTITKQSTGAFVFNDIDQYPAGMYRVYFNDSLFTEVIINKEDIVLESDAKDVVNAMKVQKSIENLILFEYWKFALEVRDSLTLLSLSKSQIETQNPVASQAKTQQINQKIDQLNDSLMSFVDQLQKNYPDKFAPKLIKSYTIPSFEKYQLEHPKEYENEMEYYYDHFFDNIDFTDQRFVYTKVLFVAMGDFMKTYGQPASTQNYVGIIDQVMQKAGANPLIYEYCLDLFMRTFEQSIWEDVMVHLIDNYYLTSINRNQAASNYYTKVSSRIKSLKPGRTAPNIIAADTAGELLNISLIPAKAKMIVFYSSQCPHCAEALPGLIQIYEMYKDQGLEAFGFAIDEDITIWKSEIEKFKMTWNNISDLKGLASEVIGNYNITSTPSIIILDKNNVIMMKPKNMNDVHATLVQLLN
jgi:thiol-disulfide isomerase/thioredoxin